MRYEDLDILMRLVPLDRKTNHDLGTEFTGAEWDTNLNAWVMDFHDSKLALKTSVVFKNGKLYVSIPYGDTKKLSDFDCAFYDPVL